MENALLHVFCIKKNSRYGIIAFVTVYTRKFGVPYRIHIYDDRCAITEIQNGRWTTTWSRCFPSTNVGGLFTGCYGLNAISCGVHGAGTCIRLKTKDGANSIRNRRSTIRWRTTDTFTIPSVRTQLHRRSLRSGVRYVAMKSRQKSPLSSLKEKRFKSIIVSTMTMYSSDNNRKIY